MTNTCAGSVVMMIGLMLGSAMLSCPVIAQPDQGPTGTATAGTATAGTATVGPGRLVTPADMARNEKRFREERMKAPLFTAAPPTEQEIQAAKACLGGRDPRALVAKFTRQFAKPQGPPTLTTGTLSWVDNEALRRTFDNRLFYILRFRQYPIAANLPEPFQANNIFSIDGNGKVEMFTNVEQLTRMFQATVHGVTSEDKARNTMLAWLRLGEELVQDGMYAFQPPIVSRGASAELVINGSVTVEPRSGNMGQIDATIRFTPTGDVETVQQTSSLQAGMRPICQSTKLLDADPIVRKMAEQDLLIMGRSAKDYLDEQRAKSTPELQAAIDRIWQRIVKEGR
jgi:hypothetical protein